MVEIGETFHRFQRVVRDVSRKTGYGNLLDISGAETELDKTVVEKITDHASRSAIRFDHGIEPAAERVVRAVSRPPAPFALNAFHGSGSIVTEVATTVAG